VADVDARSSPRRAGNLARFGLPTKVRKLGYVIQLDDPPSGERIVPAGRIENIVVEGSHAGIRTAREQICRVMRYSFQL
jgi:hypothetical protein